VTSHVGSLLLDDDGAVVAATQVIARLDVPDAFAFVLTGGHGGVGAADALAPPACSDAASSVPGTATQAAGLYNDSLLVPAVAAIR